MLISILPVTTPASAVTSVLPFGVYTNVADHTNVVPILKKYLTSTNDIMLATHSLANFEFTTFPNQQRSIAGDSLPQLVWLISEAQQYHVNYMTYDFETWSFTPMSEQNNPVGAFNNASKIIHGAGFKFAYNPTMSYFMDFYTKLDWTKCDMLHMPFGGFVKSPSKYASETASMVTYIKSKNPRILIFDGVNLDSATPQQITTAVQGVKGIADGILVRATFPCTYCSVANLNQTLAGITK